MGQMRFHAPTPAILPPESIKLAYLAGLEAIPWHGQTSLAENILTIHRSVSESGNLYVPWHIPGLGQRILSTCTLMEREQPYCLATELARGTLHRARDLAAELEAAGGALTAATENLLRQSLTAFLAATTSTADRSESAAAAIRHASEAIDLLTAQATSTALVARRAESSLSTIMIGHVDEAVPTGRLADTFTRAFHAVSLPLRWCDHQPTAATFDWTRTERQLQWAQDQNLRVIAGPLVQADASSLPSWTLGLDYEQLERAAARYVRNVLHQFAGRVDIWVCAGRLNVAGGVSFSEEQKLRLAVAMLEATRSISPSTPVVISFDQPWAEYLATEEFDLSPLHFADALVRADLGVAGVAFEMNLGYWPGGTQPRDLLAISRHLDRWSLLGIPLIAYLTLPSQMGPDARATSRAQVVPHSLRDAERPALSQDAAEQIIRLLLTKPVLHGIVWNQWSDAVEHEFPHAGLLDGKGQPKPLLGGLAQVRRDYLT